MAEPYTAEELSDAIQRLQGVVGVIVKPVQESGFDEDDQLLDVPRLAATLREYERVVKEKERLAQENSNLLRAIVLMALPYEALRMDAESRRWIAPETWKFIVEATEQARSFLPSAARAAGEG